MYVKFQGKKVTLEGHQVKVGDKAIDFNVMDNNLQELSSTTFKGKRIYVSVPSVDTGVCDMEVRRFNEEATKLNDVKIYVISMDLPFAQTRWCGAAGIENVITVSDYKEKNFGENYGTYIKELGLLTRAVFVISEKNEVIHVEYCEEVTEEPNYEAVLKILE